MLLSPSVFHDLISGRRRGVAAGLLRFGLRLSEVPYTWAVAWRNHRYDSGAAEVCRVGVPVVSVGNLTLGGTGKTPMVEWLAHWFRGRDISVTIISRGYAAQSQGQNDEARELAQKLPDMPHLQNPDRVAAARQAVAELGCRAIVLDDAFQHRRMGRDLDIVMLDALEPFGFGHVFPRGTLREPLCGLRRADVVVLSRADMLDSSQRESIRGQVAQYAPNSVWAEAIHRPQSLISSGGIEEPIETLRGKPVAAFCGIGNPAGFRHTLDSCGYCVAGFREFPDHHHYTPADAEGLGAWAGQLDVAAVVCTQKDLVKLDVDRLGGRPLRAVRIGLELLSGRDALEARLTALLGRSTKGDILLL